MIVYRHGGMQLVGYVASMALITMGHRHTLTPFKGGQEENLPCRSQGEVSTCSASQSNLFGGLRLPSLPGDEIKSRFPSIREVFEGILPGSHGRQFGTDHKVRMVSARERRPT